MLLHLLQYAAICLGITVCTVSFFAIVVTIVAYGRYSK